jgi:hypothetical protein
MKIRIIALLMLCVCSTNAISSVNNDSADTQTSRVAAIKPSGHVYTSEELGNSLFATHLTSEFPDNLVIKAHKVVRDDKFLDAYKVVKDSPRGGNFWALGSPIHNHAGASFDHHHFGIVLPFRELYNQLLNVCPSDVFTLGDFDLKKAEGAHLFVPEGTELNETEKSGIKIHTYNGDLRQVIKNFLSSEKVWEVTLKEKPQGSFSLKDLALLAETNININTPEFFKSLLSDKPHVSYGKELVSHVPRDGILAQIRFLLDIQDLIKDRIAYRNNNDLVDYNIEPIVILADLVISNLREVLEKHSLKPYAGPLIEQLDLAVKYFEMLRVELSFKKRTGIVGMDLYRDYLQDLPEKNLGRTRLVDSPKALGDYIDFLCTRYHMHRNGGGEKSIDKLNIISIYLINFPLTLLEKYFAHPDMKTRAPLWRNLFWYNRFIRRDYGCIYAGLDSSQENDFLNFQLTLKDVTAYVEKEGLDLNVLLYTYVLMGPLDTSVKDDMAINNRIKAFTEPALWHILKRIPEFSIFFDDEHRTFSNKVSLIRATKGLDGRSVLEALSWVDNEEPSVCVEFNSPFLK